MATEPYIGEIFIVGFNFNPRGFSLCNGQIISIAQNTALFSILGTTYGGNGTSTFALPDLRGRVANSMGQGPGLSSYVLGEISGSENVTLTAAQMPVHNHLVNSNNSDGSLNTPVNNYFAGPSADKDQFLYNAATAGSTPALNALAASFTGSSSAHNNMMPCQVVNFIIAMQGVFPSRN
jgi:microcystin-dependent protein